MTILSILVGLVIGLFSAIAMILVVIALCVQWWNYKDKKNTGELRQSIPYKKLEEHMKNVDKYGHDTSSGVDSKI